MNEPNVPQPYTLAQSSSPPPSPDAAPTMPQRIGRYRVERLLGEGGFGRVYLARDEELQRAVAIKVPHAASALPARGRRALSGRGPHPRQPRPPPHRAGLRRRPHRGRPVLRRLQVHRRAATWRKRIAEARPAVAASAELTATIAEALHHAHKRGLVHRDVKPANILLDGAGKPFLADFGLALREAGLRQGGRARRHAGLHESRAGPRRRPSGRWPLRHLQPGRGPLRTADRPAALSGRQHGGACWSRSKPSRPGRRGRSTTPSPRNWNASA